MKEQHHLEQGRPGHQQACPLCAATKVGHVADTASSAFFQCGVCRLTFRDPARWPSPEAEKARYRQHRNHIEDPRYRAFLLRLGDPVSSRLEPASFGLDFGCGPGPVLSVLLRDEGHEMVDYDPFFAPEEGALDRTYDFITCSEVLEHLHDPAAELARIDGLLRPGGLLGVMTGMVGESTDFAGWHYARDPTHVCFFHDDTMRWIAREKGWELERPARDVTIFHKRS